MGSFIEKPRFTCALGGAIAAVNAIPRAIPIIHGPPGCAGNLTWTEAGGCGLQVGGYCGGLSMPGSNIQEREVIFGGDERLTEQIENTLSIMDGDLYFVLTSCVAEIIGDDLSAAIRPFAKHKKPLIYAETGGFKGNSYLGYELVVEALLEQFATGGGKKRKGHVNLWGIAPYFDVFWRGNLAGLRELLIGLGLKVNTFFTLEDGLKSIKQAGQAELNIIVSDVLGERAADLAETLHGTPSLFTSFPIGPSATSEFLSKIGLALGIEDKAKKLIRHKTEQYYQLLEPLTDCFNDMDLQRYAAIIGDANYAIGITRFLADDLGWLPEYVAVTDVITTEQQEKIRGKLQNLQSGLQPEVVFSGDTSTIRKWGNEHWQKATKQSGSYANGPNPAVVIGSSFDRELAKDLKAPHLSVTFPVANRAVIDRGYTGYQGGLHLIEDVISTVIIGR